MKLKLCHITHAYETRGGVEIYLKNLNNALLSQTSNLEIHVLYPTTTSNAESTTQSSQGENHIYLHFMDKDSWHSPNALNRIRYVWQRLAALDIEYNFDLYHHHAPFDVPLVLGTGALLLRRKPVVFTYYGTANAFKLLSKSHLRYILKKRLAKVIFSRSHCTGICDASKTIYQGLAFESIGSAVDCDFFNPSTMDCTAIRMKLGLADRFIVIYPARISEPKGQIEAIQVIETLKDRFPKILLHLIGSYDFKDEYYFLKVKNYIQSHALHTWVRVTVQGVRLIESVDRACLKEWYRAADALLFTSFYEGLPLVILEAASMELPIVASKVGGIPEVIQHGENGFLVNSKDINEFAQLLTALIENEQLRQKLGKHARKNVEKHFSPECLARRCLDYYSRILHKGKKVELY